MEVPASGVRSVSGASTTTRSGGRSTVSHSMCWAICAMPWPMQAAEVRMCTRPSSTETIARPTSGTPMPSPEFLNATASPAWGSASQSGFSASRHSARPTDSSAICPFGSSAPGRTTFRYRNSQASMPAVSASRLTAPSIANADCATPKPRNAPAGGLFV